jgi:hypothetical protein
LLVKQPLVDGLWWVIEPMAVALLVRRDPSHVDLPRRHLRQEPIEVIEVALLYLHDWPPVPRAFVVVRLSVTTPSMRTMMLVLRAQLAFTLEQFRRAPPAASVSTKAEVVCWHDHSI